MSFRSYPCYLNIILSFVILVDNLFRLMPDLTNENWFCYFQAIGLGIFDKLTVIAVTINAFLTYVGFVHNKFYEQYIKALFLTSIIIGILIAIIFTTIFILLDEPLRRNNFCYLKRTESKEKTDGIFTVVLVNINFFCIINVLICLSNIMKNVRIKKHR